MRHADDVGSHRFAGDGALGAANDLKNVQYLPNQLGTDPVAWEQWAGVLQFARQQSHLLGFGKCAVPSSRRQDTRDLDHLIECALMFLAVLTDIERSEV